MNSSEYQVTIKSANQKVDDYVTKCRPTWTVHRLKQHISETHISKPTIEDQRLIYAGNLLKDSHTLKQIFFRDSLCTELTNSSKTDFTIHLVCHMQTQKVVNGPHAQAANSSQSSARTPPQPSLTTATPTPIASPSSVVFPSTSSSSAGQDVIRTRPTENDAASSSSAMNQQQAPTNTTPITQLFNSLNHSVGQTSPMLDASQQAELVQNLMHSEQMRQQMAVFQQLAYLVAAQIANNVAMNSNNLVSNNSTPANNNIDQAIQVPGFVPVLNGQTLNVQFTASSSNNNHNNHITSTASQMLYAGNRQQTQFVQADTEARAGVNENDNLNNENVNNQGEPAAARLGFRAQMQAQPPVIEQPAAQPDPEVAMLEHDVIDWVYYSIRAFVLMAALYIHASMFRLLFLVGLLAVAYFFNRRSTRRVWVAAPRQQEEQRQPRAAQEVNAEMDNNRQGAQEEPELRRRNPNPEGEQVINDNNNDNNEPNPRAQADEAVHGRVPFLKLCYLVVTDFLASLVPE